MTCLPSACLSLHLMSAVGVGIHKRRARFHLFDPTFKEAIVFSSLAIRLRIIIKSLFIRVTKIISPLPFTTPAARRRSEQKRQTLYRIGTIYTHILLERTRFSPSTHDLLLYRTSLEKVPFTCLQRYHPLIGY